MQADRMDRVKAYWSRRSGVTGFGSVLVTMFLVSVMACSSQPQVTTSASPPQASGLPGPTKERSSSAIAVSSTATRSALASPTFMPAPTNISAAPRTSEPPMAVLDPTMGAIEGWTTYRSDAGGYILPVPRNWPITDTSQGHGWIEFQDPNAQAGGDTPTVRGGLSMPGRYATTPGGDDLSNGLPDTHKEILFEQAITTPAGTGKVFTLKRDTPPSQNAIWFEQYAVIPADEQWYVIWVKIPASSVGGLVPELAQMLEGFRLIGDHASLTPHT